MEMIVIRAVQLFLSLSILVLLHEGGHFFFSKLFGIRVEKFYLFFDVGISSLKWKGQLLRYKPKNSDTEFGVGWLPFGGYCKIAGMIDESFDTDQLKQPEQPWEFRAHPAWQRLLVMLGGVLVNFLVALFIYSMLLFSYGESYVASKDMTLGMEFNDDAKRLGFRDGDVLVGTPEGEFREFGPDMFRAISTATEVNILRQGKPLALALPGDLNLLEMIKTQPVFARPITPCVVDSVAACTEAGRIGLAKGDSILAINGTAVSSYGKYTDEIARLSDVMAVAATPADSMRARKITLVVGRQSGRDTLAAVLSPELTLGYYNVQTIRDYRQTKVSYGFFESFPAGAAYGCKVLGSYVSDMKYVFTADGAKSVGGFGAIASLFPAQWDWYLFWRMTAFLSIILAFMNFLPIPALDGGHIFFLLWEIITRRKPSDKFLLYAENVGFVILIALLLLANMNDVLRWIGVL